MMSDVEGPINFAGVVERFNGLPLMSRSVDDILADYQTEARLALSQQQSLARRSTATHNVRLVSDFLDVMDEHTTRLGKLAVQQLTILNSSAIR